MNTLSLPVLSAERFMAQALLRGAVAGVVGMAWALVAGASPPLPPSEAVSAAPLYSCPGPLFTNDIHPLQARAQGCTLAQQGRWSQAQAPALTQVAAVPLPHALPTGAVVNTPQTPPPTPAPIPAAVSLGSSGASGSSGVSGHFVAFDGLPTPPLGAMPVPAPQVSQLPLAAATVAAPASGQSNIAPSVAPPLALRPTASATVSHTASPISAPPPSPQAAPAGSGGDAQRQRDRHAREIVLAELASTQARIQSLSARTQVSADEDNALQRLRRDEEALRRELARRPG
ncbi:MAG: hypothetical protein CFE38_07380 [Comamonadaceae bacterium PBBC1]|nr:MAG: hypothetical protein CFE38_07380 [Comamonadaceae bacterium PBBC1]